MRKLVLFSLFLFSLSASAVAGELALHFYPSPGGVSWKSPRAIELLTGMVDAHQERERELVLKEKLGLGVLFHVFEGRLQIAGEVSTDLKARYRTGAVSWVKFLIDANHCSKIARYFDEYTARGAYRRYGLSLKPSLFEGAGCSAFAVSFLEAAGLLDAEFERNWAKTVRVPEGLVGGKGRRVGVTRVLWASRWAGADEPHREIHFGSPDHMHEWVQRTWRSELALPTGRFLLEKKKKRAASFSMRARRY